MPRPTYHHIWDGFVPASLDDQIALMQREIPIQQAIWDGKARAGKVHPDKHKQHMHTLRSVLFTLRRLQEAGGLALLQQPGMAEETPAQRADTTDA